MAKNNAVDYGDLDTPSGVIEINDLHPGEIACVATKLAERSAQGTPIIELTCQIVYTGAEGNPNEEFEGKEFVNAIFLGGKAALTVSQLKGVFRNAGFDVPSWKRVEDGGEIPMSQALPGAIKLLFTHKVPFVGKVSSQERDGVSRNFFNFKKILREDPKTGEPYENALPLPVPNELVAEAFNTAVATGDKKDVI